MIGEGRIRKTKTMGKFRYMVLKRETLMQNKQRNSVSTGLNRFFYNIGHSLIF